MAHFITQQDADFFFEMEKFPEEDKEHQFPGSGQKLILSFTSTDKREKFLFDIYRGSIKITKAVYQNRVRKAYILRRLDFDGAPLILIPKLQLFHYQYWNLIMEKKSPLHIYIYM